MADTSKLVLDFEKPIVEIERRIAELRELAMNEDPEIQREIERLLAKSQKLRREIYAKLTRWQRVQLSRHPLRPYTLDFIDRILTDFVELHGDRNFRDDPAIVAGIGKLDNRPVAIIGHQKGRDMKEKIRRNFGYPHPEGYRKALRVMHLAEKFGRPIICLVDTPGAYPGIGSEERGQAEAIARNLFEMARLQAPIIVVVIGEGGSGGALGIGVGDVIMMMENTWYSVISPEGCASILFHDASRAEYAAESMRVTPADLLEMGLIDRILDEPLGGAHADHDKAAAILKKAIVQELDKLIEIPRLTLVSQRIEKFSAMGLWKES
ncbi:acetyl-CoA carboxylase carboxyltransferase subunit alpha [candidate division KSB1 bacterium]|nr:acetyl-CoA carboxylase carboxyltransferase subunit alpha [candidate division KSB1 bacterium]RQW09463.1 MAG: acetyl-CoA carboxylase carboxyltransferase subunit alpha [candidate division KSB1 bacterium]